MERKIPSANIGADGSDTGDRLTYIGPAENPILWCKKRELAGLIEDETFAVVYDAWVKLRYLGKLPMENLQDNDPDLIDCLVEMQALYEANWSHEQLMVKYKEAELKLLSKRR